MCKLPFPARAFRTDSARLAGQHTGVNIDSKAFHRFELSGKSETGDTVALASASTIKVEHTADKATKKQQRKANRQPFG
eukprot:3627887-Rhodomonas_salina.1